MAANYWDSTQRTFWSFSRERLADIRDNVEVQNAKVVEQYPYPDRRLMFIFIREKILQLAKRLSFRQQCVATALVYIHRYLLRLPMQNVNIYLLVATAFYLASKTEESPHHIRLVASEARQAWPEYVPGDVTRVGEMEFCLISEMRSQLIIWHPYRTLLAMKEQDLMLTNDDFTIAWSIINDTFLTDLPLTCPPHLVAITALFLAVIFSPSKSYSASAISGDPISGYNPPSFSSLGGRQGLADTFNIGLNNIPLPSPGGTQATSKASKTEDSMSVQQKTIAAAANSPKMQKMIRFLVESDIDVEEMIMATQEIISLYELWESQYNDKVIKEALSKCLKSRGIDS